MCAGGYPPYRESSIAKSEGSCAANGIGTRDTGHSSKSEKKEKRPRWVIRCRVDGRLLELETAYPLRREFAEAAAILAKEDLRSIRSPREPQLVWLGEFGEELEVHSLSR